MSLSGSRYNAAVTNASYHLRAAVEVREIAEQVEAHALAVAEGRYAMRPNYEVIGTCGHRLEVYGGYAQRRIEQERSKIEAGKPRRRRCHYCPREA